MPSRNIILSGQLANVAATDASRLSVYVLLCNQIIAQGSVLADGTYRLNLARAAINVKSGYGLSLAVAPSAAGDHLQHLSGIPRVALSRETLEKAEGEYRVHQKLEIPPAVLKNWWIFCRWYCVSGTVVGGNCPAPGAHVTVYTVSTSGSSYTTVPQATVTTAPDGTFTACFEWCACDFCFCWPCWPIWWDCWPWWWEYDMLQVIKTLEALPLPSPAPVEAASINGLVRPEASDLVRGRGFPVAAGDTYGPDPKRTALIKSKFTNANLRAIFPWWWWCCDNPNIIFSVVQNGNQIVNENPAIDTRWCFADGGSVTLVGNSNTSTACNPNCPPLSGFVWTNVGDIDVSNISEGYAEPPGTAGTDYQDMAFAGSLDLFGQFAADSNVSYYQVVAAQWSGDPARGGTAPAPGSGSPVAAPLYHTVYIYNPDGSFNSSASVQMGPFTQASLNNLYATPAARQAGPTPPGLAPFPPVPAGGSVYWDFQGLMLTTDYVVAGSSVLIAGAASGAVDLTVEGFDSSFAPVDLTPDDPLTLTIDNSPITTQQINLPINAFKADGTPAIITNSGACPAYDLGPGGYVQVSLTVSDANGHLFEYYLDAEYGSGSEGAVTPPGVRGYISNPLVCSGSDPNYAQKSWIGCTEVMTYYPPTDCCYEFRIRYGKRVTNGYSYPSLADGAFQTISLKVSS
jgi:hypothetical protein